MTWTPKLEEQFRAQRHALWRDERIREKAIQPLAAILNARSNVHNAFTTGQIDWIIANAQELVTELSKWFEPIPVAAESYPPVPTSGTFRRDAYPHDGSFILPVYADFAYDPFDTPPAHVWGISQRNGWKQQAGATLKKSYVLVPLNSQMMPWGKFVGWCTVHPESDPTCYGASSFVPCGDGCSAQHPTTPGGATHKVIEIPAAPAVHGQPEIPGIPTAHELDRLSPSNPDRKVPHSLAEQVTSGTFWFDTRDVELGLAFPPPWRAPNLAVDGAFHPTEARRYVVMPRGSSIPISWRVVFEGTCYVEQVEPNQYAATGFVRLGGQGTHDVYAVQNPKGGGFVHAKD